MLLYRQFDFPGLADTAQRLLTHIAEGTPILKDLRERKIYRFFSVTPPAPVLRAVPEIAAFFAARHLRCNFCAVICALPQIKLSTARRTSVHIDCTPQALSFNWPVMNCADSTTYLYKIKADPIAGSLYNGGGYYLQLDQSQCDVVDQFQLTRPTLFNAHVAHSVANPTDAIRLAMSFRFERDPFELLL